MSRAAAQRKKTKVSGIAQPAARDKFLDFVRRRCSVESIPDKGSHVSLHIRVTMEDKNPADIIIFTNDTITISASPYAKQTAFENLVEDIRKVAEMSTKSITITRPLAVKRAQELVEYAGALDTSAEKERMVAVILSDTANEIVLREKLRSLKIGGPALDVGVPDKIERIKEKGEQVYKESEVISIRELRNEVVHRGNIPTKAEADEAIRISLDFVTKA